MSERKYSAKEKTRLAQRVTLIGMVLDILLGVAKIIIGTLVHSVALVADGIHSFSDAITDIMVLVITRYSRQEPDEEHPYGHERFETLGTIFLGSTLIAIAGAMAWDSMIRLVNGNSIVEVSALAIGIAVTSIIGKEWIFRYTLNIAHKIKSNLLIANAWHSRSDAISSVVVLIALLGSGLGLPWLDAVAACIVGFLIAKIGWELAWDSIKVLVDTAPSPEETKMFHDVILATDGVKNVHSLRCRHMGEEILLDVHLQVAPAISVSEGHQIGLVVCKNLREKFDHIKDITYHIDAEDDDHYHDKKSGSRNLPLRKDVMPILKEKWSPFLNFSEVSVKLHYLNNSVQIDLMINANGKKADDIEKGWLTNKLVSASSDLDWLGQIKVWYSEEAVRE
ncbi:MAG: cation transporter [Hahellaceae bacterium]|nr:cation transporter [Hahellaceae bacterium]MCP5211956.1 cation transporter [Hahellaceae bacterium]